MGHNVYFITGATGFLGQEILTLIGRDRNSRFYCLVRGKDNISSQKRLDDVWADLRFEHGNGFIAVEGDMRRERFGFADEIYNKLSRDVTQVIHCAADVRFNQPLETIRLVNVVGTQNVCEFAWSCQKNNPRFDRLNYVGTSFVAGNRKGIVTENDLSGKYGFKNTYEQTKYEAEVVVRSYISKGLPAIIFRPSIVVGRSQNGKANTSNVAFPVMKVFQRWNLPFITFKKKTTFDLVPVDFVAASLVYLSANEKNIGKTFHLTAGIGKNITLKRCFEIACRVYEKKIWLLPCWVWSYFLGPIFNLFQPLGFRKEVVEVINESFGPYIFKLNPIFSNEETQKALAGSGIEVHDVERLLENFIDYAKQSNFARRASNAQPKPGTH